MKKVIVVGKVTTALVLMGVSGLVFADGQSITDIAKTVTTEATAVAKLLSVASYVAGVGFAMAGILQFKAHKENPQQVQLSKPVVMIIVAACLLFLPTILTIAGTSLFGTPGKTAAEAGGGTALGQ